MHHQSAQKHAGHDWDDVEGVLAEGGEAHDGEYTAHSGAVQIPAAAQDEGHADQAVDPCVEQHGAGAEHPEEIAWRPAAVLEKAAVTRPGGPQGVLGAEQSGQTAGGAQQAEGDAEGEVIARRPVVAGGGGGPHGAHQRHQNEATRPQAKPTL